MMDIKKFMVLFVIGNLIFFLQGFGQDILTIKGKVFESDLQTPIPYVNIAVSDGLGTSTNELGEFELKIRNEGQTTKLLKVSCIGYESKQVTLKQEGNLTDINIFLEQKIFPLEQIIINSKAITTDEILKNVNSNLDKNYSSKGFQREAFVRVKRFDAKEALLQTIDIYLEQFHPKGNSKNSPRSTNLIQGRIVGNVVNGLVDDEELYWVDLFFLRRHDINSYSYPYTTPKQYTYSLDKSVYEYEGHPAFLINYSKINPDDEKNGGWPNAIKIVGKIYINESDFAILRIEEEIVLKDFDSLDKSEQAKKFDKAIKFKHLTSLLNFKKDTDGYYLSDSHVRRLSMESIGGEQKWISTFSDLIITSQKDYSKGCNPCNLLFSKAKNEENFWNSHTIYSDVAKHGLPFKH